MLTRKKKRQKLIIVASGLLLALVLVIVRFDNGENTNLFQVLYLNYYALFYLDQEAEAIIPPASRREFASSGTSVLLKDESRCACRNETISLVKLDSLTYKVTFSNKRRRRVDYLMRARQFESSTFTCDMFNVLRRGPHIKVIAYALYGRDARYYQSIFSVIKAARQLFPEWVLRVYYDEDSIDASIICQAECFFNDESDDDSKVDFCNVNKLPYVDSTLRATWQAKYMHAMTWRWLPLGDHFVDFMASRDIDSYLIERERDSVNVWLRGNTVFHVMRGEIYYNFCITKYSSKIKHNNASRKWALI